MGTALFPNIKIKKYTIGIIPTRTFTTIFTHFLCLIRRTRHSIWVYQTDHNQKSDFCEAQFYLQYIFGYCDSKSEEQILRTTTDGRKRSKMTRSHMKIPQIFLFLFLRFFQIFYTKMFVQTFFNVFTLKLFFSMHLH